MVVLFNTFIKYFLSMNATKYIKYLLSIECYSFSVDEIVKATDGTRNSLKFELHRLSEKGEVVNLRKGFYLIITPRYSSAKKHTAPILRPTGKRILCKKRLISLNIIF